MKSIIINQALARPTQAFFDAAAPPVPARSSAARTAAAAAFAAAFVGAATDAAAFLAASTASAVGFRFPTAATPLPCPADVAGPPAAGSSSSHERAAAASRAARAFSSCAPEAFQREEAHIAPIGLTMQVNVRAAAGHNAAPHAPSTRQNVYESVRLLALASFVSIAYSGSCPEEKYMSGILTPRLAAGTAVTGTCVRARRPVERTR